MLRHPHRTTKYSESNFTDCCQTHNAYEVSLNNGQAVVVYTAASGLTEITLAEIVDDLGFQTRPLPIESIVPNYTPAHQGTLVHSPLIIKNPPSDWSKVTAALLTVPGVLISHGDTEKNVLNVWHISSMVPLSAVLRKVADSGLIVIHASSHPRQTHAMSAVQMNLPHLSQGGDVLRSVNLLIVQANSNPFNVNWTEVIRAASDPHATIESVVLASDIPSGRAVLQVIPRQFTNPRLSGVGNQSDLSKFSRILADRLTTLTFPAARIRSVLRDKSPVNLLEGQSEQMMLLNDGFDAFKTSNQVNLIYVL
ncbi:unnamed protein product [Echinostoma caproni]|uniref:DUF1829 domain-containing protein n=1 Tax=Echinostoma caproni TaxID=27848 RepID=A0A183AWT0_9TREM|nr:unnamed protein product [Echinostoma caproni]